MRTLLPLFSLIFWPSAVMAQNPADLNQLDPSAIPVKERHSGQPKELVAILGTSRGRHWSALTCLAHSPDGKYLACGSDDGTLCIWDAAALREVATIHHGKNRHVYAVAFSADSKVLASAADIPGAELKLWDVPSGKHRMTVSSKTGHFWARGFAFDGQRLAAAGDDKKVQLWDVTKNPSRLQAIFDGHQDYVNAVALAPDGKTVVTGDTAGTFRVWEAMTGKEQYMHKTSDGAFMGFSFTADGKELFSCSRTKVANIWDWQAGKPSPRAELKHKTRLVYMALSHNSNKLATVDEDAMVHLWDLSQRQPKVVATVGRLSRGFPGEWYYHKVVFAPDGKTMSAIGGWGHAVRQWDVSSEAPRERDSPPGPRQPVALVAWAPDGRQIVAAAKDNTAWTWELEGKQFGNGVGWSIDYDLRYGWDALAVTTDGKTLAAVGWEKVNLWNTARNGPRAGLKISDSQPEVGALSVLAFAPDGKTLATGGYERPIRLIDLTSKETKELLSITNRCGRPRSLAFSPDGTTLAVGGMSDRDAPGGTGDTVRVYNVVTGRELWSFTRPKTWILSLRFAPDGRTLAIGWRNGHLTMLEVASRMPRAQIQLPDLEPYGMAFSPNNKLFATSGHDGVTIWEWGEKRCVIRLPGSVASIAWAPDGRHLATANANGTVYILRVP